MDDINKMEVRIFGQVYTVAGGETEAYIAKIAKYVDEKMKEISGALNITTLPEISVLAALNIADDYYKIVDGISNFKDENEKLKEEAFNSEKIWTDAKDSFVSFKQEAKTVSEELFNTKEALETEKKLVTALKEEIELKKKEIEMTQNKMEDISQQKEKDDAGRKDANSELSDLMKKTKEMETNFFDIQMENVQLKSELEKYKKNVVEW